MSEDTPDLGDTLLRILLGVLWANLIIILIWINSRLLGLWNTCSYNQRV